MCNWPNTPAPALVTLKEREAAKPVRVAVKKRPSAVVIASGASRGALQLSANGPGCAGFSALVVLSPFPARTGTEMDAVPSSAFCTSAGVRGNSAPVISSGKNKLVKVAVQVVISSFKLSKTTLPRIRRALSLNRGLTISTEKVRRSSWRPRPPLPFRSLAMPWTTTEFGAVPIAGAMVTLTSGTVSCSANGVGVASMTNGVSGSSTSLIPVTRMTSPPLMSGVTAVPNDGTMPQQ